LGVEGKFTLALAELALIPKQPSYYLVMQNSKPLTPALLPATFAQDTMSKEASIYDQIEIEDMTFDSSLQLYHYPCPCGDRFEISISDLQDGETIAVCPSCSLQIKIIFEPVSNLQ